MPVGMGRKQDKIVIVPCLQVNIGELISIYQTVYAQSKYYEEKFSEHEAKTAIERLTDCLVAMKAEKAVAFVGGYPLKYHDDSSIRSLASDLNYAYWVAELGVLSEYRGQGIGRHILRNFIKARKVGGAREFLLCTAKDNEPSIRLYKSQGFKRVLDANGRPVTIAATQMRVDGVVRTDERVVFRLKLEKGAK